ncbi:MAG: hypothetical protein R3B13_35955 [Polyangiaceae bacterium]
MKCWACAAIALLACNGERQKPAEPPVPARIVITTTDSEMVDLASLSWGTGAKPTRIERGAARVELDFADGVDEVRLAATGACPERVKPSSGAVQRVQLKPLFRVKGASLQLGYDTPFVLEVEPGCPPATRGPIVWESRLGASLDLRIMQNGRRVEGRTPTLESLHPAPLRPGLLAASPKSSGRTLLEARWESGALRASRAFLLAAQARATGLPSVARGERVWLVGDWQIKERPPGAKAQVKATVGSASLLPDALGRWVLQGARQAELVLDVGTHGDSADDCGRSDCHREIAALAATSEMTTVFRRGIEGAPGTYDTTCVRGCHTTGEFELDDGGYTAVLRDFGLHPKLETGPGAWTRLPRDARRTSGVTCTACHGPGAIPAPSAAWAILQTDVCAVCHDYPPQYEHVQRFEKTGMARSSQRKGVTEPPCRGCHTTAGFLTRIGASSKERRAPSGDLESLSCPTCHAPHAAHLGPELTRTPALPETFRTLPKGQDTSRVCIACHNRQDGGPSQADLIYAKVEGKPGPHAELGCTECHGARDRAPKGASHDFAVRPGVCLRCHEPGYAEKSGAEGTISARATKLAKTIGARGKAHGNTGRSRAAILAIVLEDRAAAIHNAPYARSLLKQLE